MTTIDACGRSCPEPVLMTKKALAAGEEGYLILVDNATAKENVTRYAQNHGYAVEAEEEGATFRLRLGRKS